MSHPLYVAFIWHQHQPLYKSRIPHADYCGHYRLPWVRLHGTKLDHLNFYLRLDFQPGLKPGQNLPTELRLLWFYPGVTQYNSSIPLADLPDREPLNYLFHHHLGINLLTESIWLEEAEENYAWHPRSTRAKMALNQCLELAVPWADLHIEPDYPLQLVTVLADDSKFRGYLSEKGWIMLQAP